MLNHAPWWAPWVWLVLALVVGVLASPIRGPEPVVVFLISSAFMLELQSSWRVKK